jgi:hypothetical protein
LNVLGVRGGQGNTLLGRKDVYAVHCGQYEGV